MRLPCRMKVLGGHQVKLGCRSLSPTMKTWGFESCHAEMGARSHLPAVWNVAPALTGLSWETKPQASLVGGEALKAAGLSQGAGLQATLGGGEAPGDVGRSWGTEPRANPGRRLGSGSRRSSGAPCFPWAKSGGSTLGHLKEKLGCCRHHA